MTGGARADEYIDRLSEVNDSRHRKLRLVECRKYRSFDTSLCESFKDCAVSYVIIVDAYTIRNADVARDLR